MGMYPNPYFGNPYQFPQNQQNVNQQTPQPNVGNMGNMTMPSVQNVPTMPMIDTSGFVPVANEDVARNYPVAYGKTVSFRDENAPYIYIKAMGYSQLESPVFEKYKREEQPKQPNIANVEQKIDNVPLDEIKADIEDIRNQIKVLNDKMNAKVEKVIPVNENKGGNRR